MERASLEESFWTLVTLGPFCLYRGAVHLAVAALIVAWWVAVGMIGYLVWFFAPGAVPVLHLVALVIQLKGWRRLWDWLEYRLDLGLAALNAELATRGVLPDRRGQLRFAREAVLDRFGDPRAMASVRHELDSTLRTLLGARRDREIELPAGSVEIPAFLLGPFVRVASELTRGAIFARAFLRPDENLWRVAGDGVQLHASHGERVARQALAIAFVDRAVCSGLLLISILLVGLPVYSMVPATFQVMGAVAPFLLVHLLRRVVLHPLAVTMVTRAYLSATSRREVDPAIGPELERLSEAFREIRFQQTW